MLLRLLLLFTVVPFLELVLLLQLAERTSAGFTLGLILLTGVVGAALARREGIRCWSRVRRAMAAGQLPGDPLLDALMVLVAGALLVTPGILTDVVGFSLLVPLVRQLVKRYLKRHFAGRFHVVGQSDSEASSESTFPGGGFGGCHRADDSAASGFAEDKIIDVQVLDVPPEKPGTE